MNVYPAQLPCALRENYGFEPVNNILRSEMVSGRARQRIAFTSVPAFVPLSWICSRKQAPLFDAWANQVAGAGWFKIKLRTTLGFDEVEIRFTETPKGPELIGVDSWKFTARCEVRERPMLEPGWAEYMPDWVVMMDVFDSALHLQWPLSLYQTRMDALDSGLNEEWPEP